jgi:hypothetical protein
VTVVDGGAGQLFPIAEAYSFHSDEEWHPGQSSIHSSVKASCADYHFIADRDDVSEDSVNRVFCCETEGVPAPRSDRPLAMTEALATYLQKQGADVELNLNSGGVN